MPTLILQNGAYLGGAEKSLATYLQNTRKKKELAIYSFKPEPYHKVYSNLGFKLVYPPQVARKIGYWLYRNLKGGWVFQELIRSACLCHYVAISGTTRVHINMYFKYTLFYVIMLRLLGKSLSLHARSLSSQVYIEDTLLSSVDRCICVSEFVASELKARQLKRKPKFHVCYDPVKDTFGNFRSKHIANFTLLAPAVISPRKGLDLAIMSFHLFRINYPEVRTKLLIAGGVAPGQEIYKNYLVGLAERGAGAKQIIFLGHTDDLARYYANAHVVFMLSKDGEAFGIVGVEAQLSSCLLIGSSHGGANEYLKNLKTGIVPTSLTPDNVFESIAFAYEHWESLAKIRSNGFHQAKSISCPKNVALTLDALLVG